MSEITRFALAVLCAIALLLVGLKFILRLAAMYGVGVGVELPLPKKFVRSHPKAAICVFTFGAPIAFVGLLAALFWLLLGQSAANLR
ncbi:MAG: hypothetical protein ACR2IF_01120 [Terriglobales bacterium]